MVPDSLLWICAQYLIPRQWLSHCILCSCFLSSVLKTRWPHLGGGRVTVCWLCSCSSPKEMPLWNKGRALTWCRSRCRKKRYWPSFVFDVVIKHTNEKQSKGKASTVVHNSSIQSSIARKGKQQKLDSSGHSTSVVRCAEERRWACEFSARPG